MGTAVLIAVLLALDKYGSAYYSEMGAGLTEGVEQSPIPLAFLALFCVPFPLIALLQRTLPTLSLFLIAVLAIEITLSFVRTALVALVPLVLVYIYVGVRRRRPAALALAGALVATTFAAQEKLATRFADLSLVTSGDASGAGSNRVAIWTSIWEEMTSSIGELVAGAGAGTSHAISRRAIGHYVDGHNDYLEYLATGGVLLVAAYAAFIAWIIRSVWLVYRDRRQSSRARAVAALAFGVLAAFFVTSLLAAISFYASLVGFALLIGLIRGMGATPGETCFDPPRSQSVARA
jgi:O-antigen ligase